MAHPDEHGVWSVTFSDFAELRDVSHHPRPKPGWTSAYCEWARPKPADLATDVLDALTRKLRDYDRLSAALTSAQAEATKQTERARAAEALLADADPPLSPLVLIETVTNALGSACTAHYEGDIALTWRRYPDGLVDWWTLAMGETATFGADGACLTDDALGDVNAMLARYGYVLEAWP